MLRKLIWIPYYTYKIAVSPFLQCLGCSCRFYPSCSRYAAEAIERYGLFKGGWLSLLRVLKCHPWCSGGIDPVPEKSVSIQR